MDIQYSEVNTENSNKNKICTFSIVFSLTLLVIYLISLLVCFILSMTIENKTLSIFTWYYFMPLLFTIFGGLLIFCLYTLMLCFYKIIKYCTLDCIKK